MESLFFFNLWQIFLFPCLPRWKIFFISLPSLKKDFFYFPTFPVTCLSFQTFLIIRRKIVHFISEISKKCLATFVLLGTWIKMNKHVLFICVGSFTVLNSDTMDEIISLHHRKEEIADIKFSPGNLEIHFRTVMLLFGFGIYCIG